ELIVKEPGKLLMLKIYKVTQVGFILSFFIKKAIDIVRLYNEKGLMPALRKNIQFIVNTRGKANDNL
ncbi:MAG: hypothetical protein ACOY31_02170, partial [Bacillota bacterium]